MTNDTIERLVSETIEPSIGFPKFIIARDAGFAEQPYKCWKAVFQNYESLDRKRFILKPAPWLTDDRYNMRLFDELPPHRRNRILLFVGDKRRLETCLDWLKWKKVPIDGSEM